MRRRRSAYVAQYRGASGGWVDIGSTYPRTFETAMARVTAWKANPLVGADRVTRVCTVDFESYGPRYTEVWYGGES